MHQLLAAKETDRQYGKREGFSNQHGDARSMYADTGNQEKLQRSGDGCACNIGEQIGHALSLRAQQTGENEACAEQRTTEQDITCISCRRSEHVAGRSQQTNKGAGEKDAYAAKQQRSAEGNKEGRGGDGMCGGLLTTSQAAADDATGAHAQGESKCLDAQQQRKADGCCRDQLRAVTAQE